MLLRMLMAAEKLKDQDMADRITEEAIEFIRESAQMDKPIFLYFATNDIHVPRDPHYRFKGKSQMGIRGDVTVQMDDCLGCLRAALHRELLSEHRELTK